MSIELVMLSNHLILCHSLILLPSIFPSIRVFSNESVLHIRWPKYWNFSISLSPSNEHSGLIFLRIDWFDLLAIQGTLKSHLQHHSSKASILFGPQPFYYLDLTSVHGYWKNYSFDQMDHCHKSDVFAFYYTVQICHCVLAFSFKKSRSLPSLLVLKKNNFDRLPSPLYVCLFKLQRNEVKPEAQKQGSTQRKL